MDDTLTDVVTRVSVLVFGVVHLTARHHYRCRSPGWALQVKVQLILVDFDADEVLEKKNEMLTLHHLLAVLPESQIYGSITIFVRV